jgi:hypothetical protein
MTLVLFSGAWRRKIHEKNLKHKNFRDTVPLSRKSATRIGENSSEVKIQMMLQSKLQSLPIRKIFGSKQFSPPQYPSKSPLLILCSFAIICISFLNLEDAQSIRVFMTKYTPA